MVARQLFLAPSREYIYLGTMKYEHREMAELYSDLREKIYNFLFRFTQNEDLAMDLLQDTFLSFFQAYGTASVSREDAIPLLYRIARNKSINHSKKFSTKKEVPDQFIHSYPDRRDFEEGLLHKDLREKMESCLSELTEQEREALLLRFVEERTLSEIAMILQTSVSSVSRLVAKATARLVRIAEKKGMQWD